MAESLVADLLPGNNQCIVHKCRVPNYLQVPSIQSYLSSRCTRIPLDPLLFQQGLLSFKRTPSMLQCFEDLCQEPIGSSQVSGVPRMSYLLRCPPTSGSVLGSTVMLVILILSCLLPNSQTVGNKSLSLIDILWYLVTAARTRINQHI